jgi:hypothetical protein
MPRNIWAFASLLAVAAAPLFACSDGQSSTGSGAGASTVAGTASTGGIGGFETSGGSTTVAGSTVVGGQAAGGAAGAAGTGASGGSGAAGLGCSALLFCDDFESYSGTPGTPWKVNKNAAGSVVIDGAQHRSGAQAVKFTTTGASAYQQALISLEKIFPAAGNAFYGRLMIYMTKAPNDGVHWTTIEGQGAAAGGITNANVRYGGQTQQRLMANYDSSGKASDCWQHSQTKMPEAKWACMEWYFDGATNTQKFWLDGASVADLTVVDQGEGCIAHDTNDKWVFPTFARLRLGHESYQADEAREVWIDDVALGSNKIGCP